MINNGYLCGRLNCDASSLTDSEKNVEISYSMGLYVHGEGRRKLLYKYSTLLLQSMNDDSVSLKKVSQMPAARKEYGVTVSCRIRSILRICEVGIQLLLKYVRTCYFIVCWLEFSNCKEILLLIFWLNGLPSGYVDCSNDEASQDWVLITSGSWAMAKG